MKTLSQITEARGRRSARDSGEGEADAGDSNIVYQMRKVINLRGKHEVKFADGSKLKVHPEHAHHVISQFSKIQKPIDKHQFVRSWGASADKFKKLLGGHKDSGYDSGVVAPHIPAHMSGTYKEEKTYKPPFDPDDPKDIHKGNKNQKNHAKFLARKALKTKTTKEGIQGYDTPALFNPPETRYPKSGALAVESFDALFEAFIGMLSEEPKNHRVHFSYDDPSGTGRASANVKVVAYHGEGAKRKVRGMLSKPGSDSKYPNAKVHSATAIGPQHVRLGEEAITEDMDKTGDKIEHAHQMNDIKTMKKHIAAAPTKHLQGLHHFNMGYSGAGEHPTIKHIYAELKKRNAHNYKPSAAMAHHLSDVDNRGKRLVKQTIESTTYSEAYAARYGMIAQVPTNPTDPVQQPTSHAIPTASLDNESVKVARNTKVVGKTISKLKKFLAKEDEEIVVENDLKAGTKVKVHSSVKHFVNGKFVPAKGKTGIVTKNLIPGVSSMVDMGAEHGGVQPFHHSHLVTVKESFDAAFVEFVSEAKKDVNDKEGDRMGVTMDPPGKKDKLKNKIIKGSGNVDQIEINPKLNVDEETSIQKIMRLKTENTKLTRLHAQRKDIVDRIDNIVKDGGQVPLNDPFSRRLFALRKRIRSHGKGGSKIIKES